jgi:16S rRNA processing protein RimM
MKVSVANIGKPRGYKGELAVIPYRPGTETLRVGLKVTLKKGEVSEDSIIQTVKILEDRIGLKLKGIESESDAEYWRGGEILVDDQDLQALDSGEYYHFQIEGAEVFEENGQLLGVVKSIDFLSANDVLTVQSELGEILIPFVQSVIVSVDAEKKKIVIRKLEGLY